MIPKRLIRTAPDETTPEMDRTWQIAQDLHPAWEYIDIRNSIDPTNYPITSPYWPDCESGAQWADMVRFEELLARGGLYIDSDLLLLKPLNPFLGLDGVIGYEDTKHLCIAAMGFKASHPALEHVIDLAIQRRHQGTWTAGMGSANKILKGRSDLLFLPPGSFFPVHYREEMPPLDMVKTENPWAYGVHFWAHSWAQVN